MKNQFVADINDFFKYGLLRLLACRPDDPYLRILDFQAMVSYLRSCPVVFADPDNGLETKTNGRDATNA